MQPKQPDSCPGVLRPHAAADGALVRVRLPGGALEPAQLDVLAELAGGEPLEFTSRGNLQLRGVTDLETVRARLVAAGLLPSSTHERVRNIVASPLAAGLRATAARLDEAIRSRPGLAELPGRFLFALDEDGDVASLAADAESRAGVLHLAGRPTDLPGTVDALLDAAQAFLDLRTDEWRIRDLPEGAERIAAALGGAVTGQREVPAPPTPPPVGWFDLPDGAVTLGMGVPLGRLEPRTAQFVAAVDHPITITPWRTLHLHGLDEGAAETVVRVLAPMGLIFDANAPLLRVSACVGDHGCARAQGDSLAHAARAAERIGAGERVHVVACERGCGAPPGEHRRVVLPLDDPAGPAA
ncbi:precorrin-3B synthase [Tsukamurella conjunctivitidis]|uniref:Precorrin-3B synthase n=2 Tax=Tsukamurella TaxID=2060 RepID=A0A5C5RZU9_9ACTN|nr:nitrite/sulfite reductase [Tsukamurella conjunctivitidis]NMD54174.1 precorrin-3B synthase [Tsukamurella columbiensis]TWS28374.1 precorrin-3B synthase [Tsukamurella conjunctivitidis]